ncbi:MAG: 4Fe-4S dicluster domain-containing protein [Spirochaetales bacterium]|nr:4Fe-4S dicluster domain-containing protein [Spirochaetales bacterium]HNQ97468.1 4Fe-4S dicluster domain-containing protein [Treponemataceae bacterium]
MKRGKIEIDRERCKGCLLCVHACPFTLIAVDSSMNSAGVYPVTFSSGGRCTACTSCYRVCPDCAITVYELEEGEV